ncbi:MAG: oxygen-independent coproporphyrinogen III oxidase [Pseudomonadota bacterium]
MDSVTQLRRMGLFDARVPRYTSYPTANHFGADIGPNDMGRWISAIPTGSEISLYVHIPFCRRLCWFCACRTQGTATAAPVQGYLEIIKQELALVADRLPDGVTLSRLHWGGGTPTLLDPAMMSDLAATIERIAPLAPNAEFSVEIDPNEIDADRLNELARIGMNRASIGVQDFDPDIQATIGRPQTFEMTKDVVDGLRDRGVESLNVDILYGLPHQTEQRISDSVQQVLTLSPDRVALYGYAHVPWMARRQAMIPTEALPVPEARLELYETARKLFVWDGYREIGIDHFARPGDGLARAADAGTLRRNFQGYTDDPAEVLIGVGASSISRFPQGFAQNNPSTSGYHQTVRDGGLATVRGHAFTAEDKVREAMIGKLMCDFAIDFIALGKTLGLAPSDLASRFDGIEEVFPDILDRDGTHIEIKPVGRPLTRMIARYLDTYAAGQTGHSAAI